MKKLTILFLVFKISAECLACSCNEFRLDLPIQEFGLTNLEINERSDFSDLIFTGRFIQYHSIKEEKLNLNHDKSEEKKFELMFKLIKSYKGPSADTLRIRTNYGSDACGFAAKQNSECLIFAKKGTNGFYYTYSSECCRSISKEREEKRYNRYLDFIESIINMKDGNYNFKQSKSYWDKGYPSSLDTLDLISYGIVNGQFDGEWKITDRSGLVIEQGHYENGEKEGIWIFKSSFGDDNYLGYTNETEYIKFKSGKPYKSKTIIETYTYTENFELNKKKTQKVIKTYKYK